MVPNIRGDIMHVLYTIYNVESLESLNKKNSSNHTQLQHSTETLSKTWWFLYNMMIIYLYYYTIIAIACNHLIEVPMYSDFVIIHSFSIQ